MTVQELMNKRKELWENAKAFVESHRDANGVLNATDSATYDKMELDIQNLTKEIQRQERADMLEAELNRPTSTPIIGKPGAAMGDDNEQGFRGTEAYAKAMLKGIRSRFTNVAEILREGTAEAGGYLVPESWEKGIMDVLAEENVMRELCTVMTTEGLTRFNLADTKPVANWTEEGGEIKFSDATFKQKTMDAYKLTAAVRVTNELLQDEKYDLANYLINELGKAAGNLEEDAIINGDGDKKPTGLFHPTDGATKANSSTITTIKGDDIINLIYSLRRPYRKNAKFLMADSNVAKIRLLKDGQGNYLWQPSYVQGQPDRVAGFEIVTSQYVPADKIAFGDYKYYHLADRGTRSIAELRELYAMNDMVAYVLKARVDGKLLNQEAVQYLQIGTPASSD